MIQSHRLFLIGASEFRIATSSRPKNFTRRVLDHTTFMLRTFNLFVETTTQTFPCFFGTGKIIGEVWSLGHVIGHSMYI